MQVNNYNCQHFSWKKSFQYLLNRMLRRLPSMSDAVCVSQSMSDAVWASKYVGCCLAPTVYRLLCGRQSISRYESSLYRPEGRDCNVDILGPMQFIKTGHNSYKNNLRCLVLLEDECEHLSMVIL